MSLSKRALKAIELMKNDRCFYVHVVQVNSYTNRKESVYKLMNPITGKVSGFSFKTYCKLEDNNLLLFKSVINMLW